MNKHVRNPHNLRSIKHWTMGIHKPHLFCNAYPQPFIFAYAFARLALQHFSTKRFVLIYDY